MGMYCACGVKKRDDWICECDWTEWFACFEREEVPSTVPIKKIPENDGTYAVRIFEDSGDDYEDESEFSTIAKNWGKPTNEIISHWKEEYSDNWTGYQGVYAWKELDKVEKD